MGIPTLPAGVPCAGPARSDSKVAAGTAGFVHASSAIAAPAGGGKELLLQQEKVKYHWGPVGT